MQMLKRKIEVILREWKQTPGHNPLIVKGCRQCGKTSSVLAFGRAHYEQVVYLNFMENPAYASIFFGSLHVDHLVMLITSLLGQDAFSAESGLSHGGQSGCITTIIANKSP